MKWSIFAILLVGCAGGSGGGSPATSSVDSALVGTWVSTTEQCTPNLQTGVTIATYIQTLIFNSDGSWSDEQAATYNGVPAGESAISDVKDTGFAHTLSASNGTISYVPSGTESYSISGNELSLTTSTPSSGCPTTQTFTKQ